MQNNSYRELYIAIETNQTSIATHQTSTINRYSDNYVYSDILSL
jgi:hypothetical protein